MFYLRFFVGDFSGCTYEDLFLIPSKGYLSQRQNNKTLGHFSNRDQKDAVFFVKRGNNNFQAGFNV